MPIVDAIVETRGALVAPNRIGSPLYDVGKGAVEQLKELIPFERVIQTGRTTSKSDGVVENFLQ